MSERLVSIIVPALNEAESLPELIRRVDAVMRERSERYELIIVDDGSRDGTRDVVEGLRRENPGLALISHFRNHGKSMALMQGFSVASGDAIVTMDADLQDQPEEIPLLLAELDRGAHLVGGWRKDRKDGFSRKLASTVFNAISRRLVRASFRDINCGFKAMTAEVVQRLELRGDMHRIIPLMVSGMGYTCREIPVSHMPRQHGKSRFPLLRHRGLLDLLAYMVFNMTQIRPFHIFCEFGFLFLVLGLLSASGYVALKIFAQGLTGELVSMLFLGFGLWAGLVGTFCPFFGLFLESTLRYSQTNAWRRTLVREYLPVRECSE